MEAETIGKWLGVGVPGGLGILFLFIGTVLRRIGEKAMSFGGMGSGMKHGGSDPGKVFRTVGGIFTVVGLVLLGISASFYYLWG